MIPILYPATGANFLTNGLGRLNDAITCTVTEERNGEYEMYMEYPVDGIYFELLELSRIIAAKPAPGEVRDYFRIYRMEKRGALIAAIYAEHVSYELNRIPVMPFTATSASDALDGLVSNAVQPCPFGVWCDPEITTTANFAPGRPEEFRSLLGGVEGSVLDVFGPIEYEFTGYLVKAWKNRGKYRGFALRYGKNIVDIEQEENIENTITGVCPYWRDIETGELVVLPEKAIWSATADNFPYKRTAVIDFTEDFETAPTVEELRARTNRYITENDIGIPSVNITVEFVPLEAASGATIGAPTYELEIDGEVSGNVLTLSGDVSSTVSATDVHGNVTLSGDGIFCEDADGAITITSEVITATETGGNVVLAGAGDLLIIDGGLFLVSTLAGSVMEYVKLCDTVDVIFEPLGIRTQAKVTQTVYNVLLERYDSIRVGSPKLTMYDAIAGVVASAGR